MGNENTNNQDKKKSKYRFVLMFLGIALGILFGVMFDNMLLIIPLGVLGSGIGLVVDNKNKDN